MHFAQFEHLALGDPLTLLAALELLQSGRNTIQFRQNTALASGCLASLKTLFTEGKLREIVDVCQQLAVLEMKALVDYIRHSSLEVKDPDADEAGVVPSAAGNWSMGAISRWMRAVSMSGPCPDCGATGKEGYNKVFDQDYDVMEARLEVTAHDQRRADIPRQEYEPVVSCPVDLEFTGTEITLCVFDIHENHEIKTCSGDICKIVNALRDYSQMLKMVCGTQDLQGFHCATYEFHAEKLWEVADKFQAGIGYDYDAAVERCEKRKGKKRRDEDVGDEAMAMGFLKSQQAALNQKTTQACLRCGKPFDPRMAINTWIRHADVQICQERGADEALLEMPEFQSLDVMGRMCRSCTQLTDSTTDFNLYSEAEHLYIWLQLVTRKRDYNLYVHFYLKSQAN